MLYGFDHHVLDVARRELRRGTERVPVEPQIFDLLVYLIEHRERVVSRDELLEAIWDGRIVSDSAITNAINGARRAIGDSGDEQHLIRTAPRKGFRFIGQVREAGERIGVDLPVAPAARGTWRLRPFVAGGVAIAFGIALLGAGVLWWRSDRSAVTTEAPLATVGPRLPIALLPFDDLSSETSQSPLAAGISEGLSTDLSHDHSLLVRLPGRTVATSYNVRDARRIGQELGVGYLVQGSILHSDDRVRVAAQLVDTATGTYLWTERFDAESRNLLDQEEEIVGRVINSLNRSLNTLRADWSRTDPDLATLIWRARAVMNVALTEDKYSEAVELYDRALARSPASVGAAAGMANVLAVRAHYLKPNAAVEDMRRADGLIKAALAAAPDSAGVHYVMGQVLRLQGHCEEAIDEYQAAIALNRNYADAYAFLGACLLYTGRISPLMPLLTKAVRLDPTNKGVGWVYLRAGVATLFETRNDEAIIWLEKARAALAARQLRDDLSATHSWLAAVYGLNGDTSRASAALAQAKAVGPFPKSIGDFCGRGCWCENPAVKSLVNDTYYKGLQLAGWSEQ